MRSTPLPMSRWLSLSSLLFIFGCLGPLEANAARILFVVDSVMPDGRANNANDREVVDRLTSKGHVVTIADDQDPVLDTFLAGQDLILISSSVASGSQPLNSLALDPLKTGTQPIVCYEPGLYDELGWQTANTFGNAGGHTSLAMASVNQSHPLAAGKSGIVSMVTSGTATFSSSALPVDVGADAIVIAANGTPGVDEGRLSIWAYDIDDRLADNTTTVPSRRVAFFFNAGTPVNVYNTNAYDLFFAAVNWALAIGASNEPPRIKNLSPANDSAFVPINQGISFSVKTISPNSIPTGNIRLILNGADVSSSLAIGGTSSNRTVNLPGPLTENTLYSGQIIASDGAGRSTTLSWTFDTVGTIRPRPNAVGINPATDILVELVDQNRQVNTNSIALSFNGGSVAVTSTKTGTRTSISYDPPGLLPSNSTNEVRLVFSDTLGASYTNTWRFVVLDYLALPVLPPVFKVLPGTVDLNRKGFLLKLRQMEVARPGGGNVDSVRRQLDDLYIDPNTLLPYADLIDRTQTGFEPGSGFNPDGTFTEAGVINYNQDGESAISVGSFTDANGFADEPIPGIHSTANGGFTDNIAMQALTYLDLKVGVYQLVVRSDDGFRASSGPGPQDVFSQILGEVNADRAAANTRVSFVVQEDGFYPFELIYWETAGGAELEFYSIDAITAANILINDPTNANGVKAYRPASITPPRPYVRSINPASRATSVATNTTIDVVIVDGVARVLTNSIQLMLNGAMLTPSITQTSGVTTISAAPPGVLPFLSSNNVTLVFSDNGSPSLTRTNAWSFTVESSLPKVLFVVATGALNASDTAARARLESVLGFEVVAVGDTASQTADANRKALIVISSTVGSGNVNTKFRDVAVPVLNWEPAIEDDLLAAPLAGVTAANQTQIEIANATHPLAAGFPAGPLTILNPAQSVNYTDPNANAVIIARLADPTIGNSPVLFVFPKGTDMEPDPTTGAPFKAPEKRVGFFLNSDTFVNLTPEGLKLFDAAVQWTSGITNTASLQPKFDPPVLSGNQLTISWTGTGNLEQTDSLSPANWSPAPSQANPQTVPATGTRFYRIRQ